MDKTKRTLGDVISHWQCLIKERHPLLFELLLMIFSGILVPILAAYFTTQWIIRDKPHAAIQQTTESTAKVIMTNEGIKPAIATATVVSADASIALQRPTIEEGDESKFNIYKLDDCSWRIQYNGLLANQEAVVKFNTDKIRLKPNK